MFVSNQHNIGKFYSGTSNLMLPVKNKLAFPDAFRNKSRLNYYGHLFNSLEINSTFYKLPMPSTLVKWADEVPAEFSFTFKVWKQITHVPGLDFQDEDISRFMYVINSLQAKQGCLLLQFPPQISVKYQLKVDDLLYKIKLYDADCRWHIAVEFRHKSWYISDVYNMLDSYKATLVLHDLPSSATPINDVPDPFIYLRFHGPEGGYRGSYTDAYLAEYAGYVADWLADGKIVYAYFNNTLGQAVYNLQTFNAYVNGI